MAIGPRIFIDRYKDLSIDELNSKLNDLRLYLESEELKKAREEEIRLGIDDNNCIDNIESEIKAIEILLNEKNKSDFKSGNIQVKNIIEEYKNNSITAKLIELLNQFANEVINGNNKDPFWADSAKNILKLLLVSNLLNENEITIQLLIGQTRTADRAKMVIDSNITKFNIPELQNYMTSASMLNSDKPLKSIVEIIYNSLLAYDRIEVKENQIHFLNENEIENLQRYNITYNEALEKAIEYFNTHSQNNKISKALENSEGWIFYNFIGFKVGAAGIKVDKQSGNISTFILPNKENFELLKNSKEIEVPEEYRLVEKNTKTELQIMKTYITREIVNLAEITIVANKYLQKNEIIDYILHDSPNYEYHFKFLDEEKNSVKDWIMTLKNKGAGKIYIDFAPPKDINTIAYTNATPAGLICKYNNGQVTSWHKKWNSYAETKKEVVLYQEKLCEKDYFNTKFINNFESNFNYFKAILEKVKEFSASLGCAEWVKYFNSALNLENIENAKEFIPTKLLYGLIPDKNLCAYAMALKAYPFGGMGSWCDNAYVLAKQKDLEDKYEKISKELFLEIMGMISYATTNI